MTALFSSVHYADTVSQQSLNQLVSSAMEAAPKALMILCADNPSLDLTVLNTFLTAQTIPVFGGIFPGLLLENDVKRQGVVIAGFCLAVEVELVTELSFRAAPIFELSHAHLSCPSMLVLIDGLARNIDSYLQHLFNIIDHKTQVVGGGAGSMSFVQKPCLLCNQGVVADGMLLVAMANDIELAIGHGWEKLAGPYLANQVDDNLVDQLNFQSALGVYQQIVEQHSGMSFNNSTFFDIAKTYPFGIERLDDDVLIRDPITANAEHIVCVGRIPENTMLYIMQGEADSLISASVASVHNVLNGNTTTHAFADGFLFDCVSRQLFLEEKFVDELVGISEAINPNVAILGVLVLGEIASGMSGTINFHNKTTVTALSYAKTSASRDFKELKN